MHLALAAAAGAWVYNKFDDAVVDRFTGGGSGPIVTTDTVLIAAAFIAGAVYLKSKKVI